MYRVYKLLQSFGCVEKHVQIAYIIFRRKNTGKSYFLKLLGEASGKSTSAAVSSLKDISNGNLPGKCNIVVINEVDKVDASLMRMQTGNDIVSSRSMYSQKYERFESQAMLFGGTNEIINFTSGSKRHHNVNCAVLHRVHAVKFEGSQEDVPENDYIDLLNLFSRKTNINRIDTQSNEDCVFAFKWIIFTWYMLNRNAKYLLMKPVPLITA